MDTNYWVAIVIALIPLAICWYAPWFGLFVGGFGLGIFTFLSAIIDAGSGFSMVAGTAALGFALFLMCAGSMAWRVERYMRAGRTAAPLAANIIRTPDTGRAPIRPLKDDSEYLKKMDRFAEIKQR